MKTNIIEIFSSIQGEGPYIGYKQIFVRFSGCNLNCEYCDTPFEKQDYCKVGASERNVENPLSCDDLMQEIESLNPLQHHSISLTGGEPLLHAEFLQIFLKELKKQYPQIKTYLETNGTLPDELLKIIDLIDIVSMDIKLESSTGKPMPLEKHTDFIKSTQKSNIELFAKLVVSLNVTQPEINQVIKLIEQNVPLIIQPIEGKDKIPSEKLVSLQNEFLKSLKDVRIIPQMHKYLNLR